MDVNSYVVAANATTSECVLVDPGLEPEPLVTYLQGYKLAPVAALITHGHCDHIGGLNRIKELWPEIKIYIGENERDALLNPLANLSRFFGDAVVAPDADVLLKDGDVFTVAGLTFKTLEIPGHTRGHVVYLLELADKSIVFCGDVVFAGSVGRTDLPGGDQNALLTSIAAKLLPLSDSTVLWPGHGPATTIGEERRCNYYLKKLC